MPGEPRSNQESFDAGYRQGVDDERKAIVDLIKSVMSGGFREHLLALIEARGAQRFAGSAERGEGAAMTTANDELREVLSGYYIVGPMDAPGVQPADAERLEQDLRAIIAAREKAARIAAYQTALVQLGLGITKETTMSEQLNRIAASLHKLIEKERAAS